MKGAPAAVRTVVVEREIGHPPEKIWRALTQPHLIAEWLLENDFSPSVGHRFNLRTAWGGVLDCKVLVVDPGKVLSYTWNFAHDDPAYKLDNVVTFTLIPKPGGTLLRVEQAGFGPQQKQAFGGARAGWRDFLARLDETVARLPETQETSRS